MEPVAFGSRFKCQAGPSLLQRFCEAMVVTLEWVVDLCGPFLERAADRLWEGPDRCTQIRTESSVSDPIPYIKMTPVIVSVNVFMLTVNSNCTLYATTGKTMCVLLVEVLNQRKLTGQADTPRLTWPSCMLRGLSVCGGAYKPLLSRRVGHLQWRLLHSMLAVNAFVSVLNPNVGPKFLIW